MNSKPKDPCSVVSVKNESHIRNVIHQNHSSEQAKKYKVVRDIYFFSLRKKKPKQNPLAFSRGENQRYKKCLEHA